MCFYEYLTDKEQFMQYKVRAFSNGLAVLLNIAKLYFRLGIYRAVSLDRSEIVKAFRLGAQNAQLLSHFSFAEIVYRDTLDPLSQNRQVI